MSVKAPESPNHTVLEKRALKYFHNLCPLCGSPESLRLYHKHTFNLGQEKIDNDVFILCNDCYESIHTCVIHSMNKYFICKNDRYMDATKFFSRHVSVKYVVEIPFINPMLITNKARLERKRKRVHTEGKSLQDKCLNGFDKKQNKEYEKIYNKKMKSRKSP